MPVGSTCICQVMVIVTMATANIMTTAQRQGTRAMAIMTGRATGSYAVTQSRCHPTVITTPCISTTA